MTVESSISSQIAAELPTIRVLSGEEFEERRRVWNGAVDNVPAVIVCPRSAHEVSEAVSTARRHGLAISVRGGGHDYVGRAIRTGGLVVDLAELRGVQIHGDTATVGGGATADDLLSAAAEYGMTAVVGTHGGVGVVGLLTGGGYSFLIGVLGMGVDNLVSAQVVLADGTIVVTDEAHEPDLFWALRGGGGNFGVIVSAELRVHPMPEVTAGTIAFGWDQARDVLSGLAELHRDLDDALDVMFGARHTPDGPIVVTRPVWAGPEDAARPHIDRIRRIGKPLVDDVARRRVVDLAGEVTESFPAGRHYRIGTCVTEEIDDAFVDAFTSSVAEMPPTCALNVHHAHGAATRIPVADTAYAYRQPHLVVEMLAMWSDGEGRAECDWITDTEQRFNAIALPGGWVNLMRPHDPRIRDAYGPNRTRLIACKERYDPGGEFTAIPLPGPE
jgi:FAD/FMN-containing dehydrogenase